MGFEDFIQFIREGRLYLNLSYHKEDNTYSLSTMDGRSSAKTDLVGITQELRNLGNLNIENTLDLVKTKGKISLITDSEFLRKSNISFKSIQESINKPKKLLEDNDIFKPRFSSTPEEMEQAAFEEKKEDLYVIYDRDNVDIDGIKEIASLPYIKAEYGRGYFDNLRAMGWRIAVVAEFEEMAGEISKDILDSKLVESKKLKEEKEDIFKLNPNVPPGIERAEKLVEIPRGSSLQGYMPDKVNYQDLVKAFGKPNGDVEGNYKIDVAWVVDTEAGKATIYNYKNGEAYLGEDGMLPQDMVGDDWHIGGLGGSFGNENNKLLFAVISKVDPEGAKEDNTPMARHKKKYG